MRNSLEIIHVNIDDVKPYANHARVHNRKKRLKVEKLLRTFGQIAPIIVDSENVIVDGHAVHAGLKDLGYEQISAVVVHNRDPAEIRALRLSFNRLPQEAGWDNDRLSAEFNQLLELGFDDLDLTGFDTVEIDLALTIGDTKGNTIENESLEDLAPRPDPIVRLGETWCLGRHLIACGDSRDIDLVRSLAAGREVKLVITDPPYNVKIDGFVSGLGKVGHKEFAMAAGEMSRDQFTVFLSEFLGALLPVLKDGAILFAFMDWRHIRELLDAADRHQLQFKNLCVWAKSNAGMGSFYRSQHELVFVFKHGTAPHQNNFELGQHGRTRSNVWQYRGINSFGQDRMELLEAHPTVKPITMIADAILDVSSRGDLVLDSFLGSGSTLIAAEETGRTCIGVEFDPGYVEVAIRRWEKRTGKDAVLADTSLTFAELSEARRATSNAAVSSVNKLGEAVVDD
jgi:DNA modification methylase